MSLMSPALAGGFSTIGEVVLGPKDSWAGPPASRPCTASLKDRDLDKTPQVSGTPSPGFGSQR